MLVMRCVNTAQTESVAHVFGCHLGPLGLLSSPSSVVWFALCSGLGLWRLVGGLARSLSIAGGECLCVAVVIALGFGGGYVLRLLLLIGLSAGVSAIMVSK